MLSRLPLLRGTLTEQRIESPRIFGGIRTPRHCLAAMIRVTKGTVEHPRVVGRRGVSFVRSWISPNVRSRRYVVRMRLQCPTVNRGYVRTPRGACQELHGPREPAPQAGEERSATAQGHPVIGAKKACWMSDFRSRWPKASRQRHALQAASTLAHLCTGPEACRGPFASESSL